MIDDRRLLEIAGEITRSLNGSMGVDGQNGLSSKVRNHDRRLTGIEDRLSAYDQAQLQIRTVWATARWIGLGVAALIGFIMTTPVATFLANVWRAGSGP